MALGSMTYQEARDRAEDLRKAALRMDEEFTKLRNEMDTLEQVLKSRGGTELYDSYKVLEAKLNSFPNKVRDFRTFLLKAVEQYEANDADLSSDVH